MSRNSITLKADGRKVVCAAKQRYAIVIVGAPGKLHVTKRTSDVNAIAPEFRKIRRDFPNHSIYLFDLPTGNLLMKAWAVDTLPDSGRIGLAISAAPGRG